MADLDRVNKILKLGSTAESVQDFAIRYLNFYNDQAKTILTVKTKWARECIKSCKPMHPNEQKICEIAAEFVKWAQALLDEKERSLQGSLDPQLKVEEYWTNKAPDRSRELDEAWMKLWDNYWLLLHPKKPTPEGFSLLRGT